MSFRCHHRLFQRNCFKGTFSCCVFEQSSISYRMHACMYFSFHCTMNSRLYYSNEVLMSIRQSVINSSVGQPVAQPVWKTLNRLNIAKSTKRGFRGGWRRKKLHIKTHTTEGAYKAPSIRHNYVQL